MRHPENTKGNRCCFHSQEAIELFKKHGARVNGNIVYFDAPMVEKALATCPEKFVWHARNEERSVTVGREFDQPNIGQYISKIWIKAADRLH